MRRQGELFDEIASRDNLREAVGKALRGKRAKLDAREFVADLDHRLVKLRSELLHGTPVLGRMRQFVIHDPKERLITAPCFEERVLHHAIMNLCEPVFERWLIDDCFACRRGKGREACLARAQYYARKYTWFLRLDIRKYFDSINHRRLLALLKRRFKDVRLLALLERIVNSYRVTPHAGLPIGSLTSQHFANFYLGVADRMIKERLRAPGYVRYMDDMVIWGHDSRTLAVWRDELEAFLRESLELTVKPEPFINRTKHGIDLLGCRVFPRYITLNARSRRRFRRKLPELEMEHRTENIGEASLQKRGQALLAFVQSGHVKSWSFRTAVLNQSGGDSLGHEPGPPRW